jgi:hypothetical protein
MSRGTDELQARLLVLERRVAGTIASLHHIRARTTRVLTATNAFSALQAEVLALSRVIDTLARLSRASDDSVDRQCLEGQLSQLSADMAELQRRFEAELRHAADSAPPPPKVLPRKPWWRVGSS